MANRPQIATEYGMKAQDAARQMHYVDPTLKLIAYGSSLMSHK